MKKGDDEMERIGEHMKMSESVKASLAAWGIIVSDEPMDKPAHMSKPAYDEPYIGNKAHPIESYGIMKRYQSMTFETISKLKDFDVCDRESYREAYKYAKSLREHLEDGRWLLMKGRVGTGKTSLATAIGHEAYRQGIKFKFISNISLRDQLMSMRNEGHLQELGRFDRELRTLPLLIIDDLGSEAKEEGQGDWLTKKIESIIGERYDRMLPTVFTTNLTREALEQQYEGKIYDRMKQASIVIDFKGNSMRKATL